MSASERSQTGHPPLGPRPFITYVVLFILGLAPFVALGVYAYQVAVSSANTLIHSNNLAVAMITRELVQNEFEHRVNTLVGFSRAPDLIEAVRSQDEEAVRQRLKTLVESHPRVVRAFITDREGLLWSDFPKAPESLGRNFAYRDWYKGLASQWQPYVSRVYRRHAEPKPLLVAIAAPVRDIKGGPVIGALVYQVRLEGLTSLLKQVEVGQNGFVFLVDHAGTVAAHPRLDLQEREYREYADTEPVQAVFKSESQTLEYLDPLSRTQMIATAVPCSVQGHRWLVVAQQPVDEAHRPVRILGYQISGAGVLLIFVLGGFLFGLARYHNRVRQLNARFEQLNQDLSRENQERGAPGQAGEVADDHAAEASPADVGQEAAQRGPVGVQAGSPGLVVGRRAGIDGVLPGPSPGCRPRP